MKPIGIDLGTTNSVVAIFERGQARTLPIYGQKTTPSVVSWNPATGQLSVGGQAKKRVMINPGTSILSNKKHMGDKDTTYQILDNTYTPTEIASIILKYLKDGASEELGYIVTQAVITVPAYFNQNQREATKKAAELAGLEVLQLQAEPTAAAISYGFDKDKDQVLLVYDLGGGTFDVSILEIKGNKFSVRGIGGDSMLGGDNFDEAIMEFVYKQIMIDYSFDLKNDVSDEGFQLRQKLKEISEEAKKELSSVSKTEISIPSVMGLGGLEIQLKRKKYQELIYPYLDKSTAALSDVLTAAKMTTDDISRVICVGGSTKSPIIGDLLTSVIKRPYMATNVDEAVALGAAITAASLVVPASGSNLDDEQKLTPVDITLTNITPFNLGIRLDGNKMGIVIPQNSQLPITVEKEFTTSYDNATETDIVIFQGNELLCSNNVLLGGFTLKNIRKAKAGVVKIKVCFTLDSSDILSIKAHDNSTGSSSSLKIEKFEPKPYEPESTKSKSIYDVRIGISPVGYDDVGAILRKIGLSWKKVKNKHFRNAEKLQEFDILFINCLEGGSASANADTLRNFVNRGGVLYASDCAYSHISTAFPEEITFKRNGGFRGDVESCVVSEEFINLLGKENMNIHFNAVCYYADSLNNSQGQTFLTGNYKGEQKPIVVGFSQEAGYVIFTAFHNYGNASKDEQELLKFIILKTVAQVTKTPLKEIAEELKK
jgi:molecular chaperone DnaK